MAKKVDKSSQIIWESLNKIRNNSILAVLPELFFYLQAFSQYKWILFTVQIHWQQFQESHN